MRFVFLGTGEFGVPTLEALCAAGHEPLVVISQPDRPAGRGRALHPTPIHAHCLQRGIAHLQSQDLDALTPADCIADAQLAIVVAFGQKIGRAWLAALPRGMINVHASLLPRYRGAAPYQWAILNGDATTGVSVFQLDQHWDNGPIWGQVETPIGPEETADELHDRLSRLGAPLTCDCVARIERGEQPRVQDSGAATRAPKLSKADGWVDWSRPAFEVVRRIHGLWSWPAAAATCVLGSGVRERLLLARARVCEAPGDVESRSASGDTNAQPGTFLQDGSIQTGAGRVQLLQVKPAGGKLMDFNAYRNGRSAAPHGGLLRLAPPEPA